ncbi:MAG TPA: amino acid adenylation domain-containing protein, partial [Thermoanaerobaculia bacterium]|nr:amino acid adenylation domain-containing protein [Thermoanaerobaculia bacterium]
MSSLSAAKRALLEKLIRGEVSPAASAAERIPRRASGDCAPLSFGQRQVWLHQQLAPWTPVYNEALTLRHDGPLDPAALSRALTELLRRHEAWRTSFPLVDDRPVQRIHPPPEVRLDPIDLFGADGEARAIEIATEDARRPFDLAEGPPLRFRLFALGESDHRLAVTLHHIVFDGVSIYRVFLPELIALYEAFARGDPSPLAEPELQYPDFAAWEAERLTPERTAEALEYFKERLAGAPELSVPLDGARPPVQTFRGSMHRLELGRELTESLAAVARREGATLYATLLAAFGVLLQRLSWQDDIVLGSVTSGRTRSETERVVGYFLRTVPLRLDLSGEPSFAALLSRVMETVLGALAHDEIPFERLVGELARRRDPSRNPLFTVLFSLEPPIAPLPPGWAFTQMDVVVGAVKFDLALELDERPEGLIGRFLFSTELFAPETIGRIARAFLTLLAAIAEGPARAVSELPLLPPEEMAALVARARAALAPPSKETIVSLVLDGLAARGDAPAVTFEGETASSREMAARSEAVARALFTRGIGRGARVATFLPRSIDAVVALAGIARSGAAFVPLDVELPDARVALLLERARVAAVITDPALAMRLPRSADAVFLAELAGAGGPDPEPPAPEDPAYILFTSGSTGTPKGVVVSHGAIAHHLAARQAVLPLRETDVFLQKAPLGFDISVWEIFGTLMAGARLAVARPEIVRDAAALVGFLSRERVTAAHFSPPALRVLLDAPGLSALGLRRVFSGGEPLPNELAARLLEALPSVELVSQYGPTEAAVDVTLAPVLPGARGRNVPIGRPLPGAAIHLLDARLAPVPDGFPGEICVAGPTLASGYLDDPEATAAAFVPDPFAAGGRLYRTGDLARVGADGELEFLSRLDGQVKIRGSRVETGEVEAELATHPEVAEVAALAREEGPAERSLVGYVVPRSGASLAPEALAAWLRERLPGPMVPTRWVFLSALPRLPSGKLDRHALPPPHEERSPRVLYEAPRTEAERALVGICAEVLRLPRVGIHDNL